MQLESDKGFAQQHVVLLEDMFNETSIINGKTYTSTQMALEFVKKLETLDLITEDTALNTQQTSKSISHYMLVNKVSTQSQETQ